MTKYRVGDAVKIDKRGVVTSVVGNDGVIIDDAWFIGAQHARHLRPASPAKPDPGAVIDGRRLKATPWRRGTVIRTKEFDSEVELMLLANAKWVSANSGILYDFHDFHPDLADIKVVSLP